MKAFAIVAGMCCCLFCNQLNAQSLNDFVSKYSSANGSGYMQPLADAFGADLNSGLYQTANIPLRGFHLNLSFMLMGAPITDSRKTFSAKTEGFFAPAIIASAPTVFGSTSGKTVAGNAGTAYAFPGGLDMSIFTIGVPQITVGSFYGTEATVRFFQAKVGDNIGQLQLWGIGVRHSISQYFKKLPSRASVWHLSATLQDR